MRFASAIWVAVSTVASLVACGEGDGGGGSGGASSGGATSGGASSGGASSGGASGGMAGSSGAGAGGSAGAGTGGTSSGGTSSGGTSSGGTSSGGTSSGGTSSGGATGTGGSGATSAGGGPPAGNPDGKCSDPLPADANLESIATPTTVVGTGTAASCTSQAFVDAVAKGGVITFNCGANPVTITLTQTAKIFNDKGPKIVIDGGGKVALSGGGKVRILYQNTCDQAQKWTTSQCQNQDHPQLSLQNLTFIDGNAKGATKDGRGGGAVIVRGARVKIINSRFFNNVCDDVGPDVGGAAVRVLSQFDGKPAYVVNSTFGGAQGYGNTCSNGGGLSSIGVSYTVINSLFSHNKAIGNGANPAKPGTPGGGSGGAIYNDGNTFTLTLCGTKIVDNTANEGGGAIFFVSNDKTGSLVIKDSFLSNNKSGKFETQGYPGIFVLAKGPPTVVSSTIK